MQQRRAGPLYSPVGCGATTLLVLMLGLLLSRQGGRPFSPGELSAASPRGKPLQGLASHAEFEGECLRCHVPWQGVRAVQCENCHTDVAEQRDLNSGLHGRLPDAGRCFICHTDHKGQEANVTQIALDDFEHERFTEFSLVLHATGYGGAPLTCESCHPQGRFEAAAVACIECHRSGEPEFTAGHGALYGETCQACHDGRDSMVNFSHEQVFPLDGAHAAAECAACHVIAIVAGTPNDCVGCHQEPATHFGSFGVDCARCHTTAAWTPAQLTRHTFPLDHGDEGKIACQVCHPSAYVEYTCTNCHAHEPAETRDKHLEEGIVEFADCVACHPTGHEAEDD